MRLAFYLAHYPAPGGTTTAVRGLTQALAELGHDVEILCQGSTTRVWAESGIRIRQFSRPIARVPFLVSPHLLAHAVRNRPGYDLLVLNGMFHRDLPSLALAARKARTPYVVVPHDPYHPALFRQRRIWKEIYWRLVERGLLENAAAIQVLAGRHRSHLLMRGVRRPIVEAPNGIDATAKAMQRRFGDESTVTVGALGRVDAWHKGLDLLLASAASLRDRGIPLRVVIQGRDQSDAPRLRHLAHDLRISDRVAFLEGSPNAIATIAGWDILAVASRFEGFGLTASEAMIAGTPVLCSEEAGVAEHVQRAGCGVVVPPTVEGLTSGLLDLLERREEWPRMASAGQAYATTELRWDRIASSVAMQYQKLVQRRRP